MEKCYLCRQKKAIAKRLAYGILCHRCFAKARQVVKAFGLAGYASAIVIINQVRVRDSCLEATGIRAIGNPLHWNQRKRKK